MESEELYEYLVATAETLWRSCLVGNQAPIHEKLFSRMKNPIVGDLVFESSNRRRKAIERTGILVQKISFDEYLIRDYAGKEVHWTNCEFLFIPPQGWLGSREIF